MKVRNDNDHVNSNETGSNDGPTTIEVARQGRVIELEPLLRRIADERYPVCEEFELVYMPGVDESTDLSDEPSPNVRRLIMLLRMDAQVRRAIVSGELTARDMEGLRFIDYHKSISNARIFIERDEMANFAMRWWMVRLVDASPLEDVTVAGRYSMGGACKAIEKSGESSRGLINRLWAAAKREELHVFYPGTNQRYNHVERKIRRRFFEEADWNDLNRWLDENAADINFRFPRPVNAAHMREQALSWQAQPTTSNVQIFRYRQKQRINELDALVDAAIDGAKSIDTATIFVALRELAIAGTPPFSGHIDEIGLRYTNAKNESVVLTMDNLRSRLNRRKRSLTVDTKR